MRRHLPAIASGGLVLVLVGAAAVLLGAFGDGETSRATAHSPGEVAARSGRPVPNLSLDIPHEIPLTAAGPPDRRALRVIRRWARALNQGEIVEAAGYFAIPSRVQNRTPVLHLDSKLETQAFNVSLPCGARVETAGARGDFTVVRFRLIERRNGNCGRGLGRFARGAIRVREGKIVDWFRLPRSPADGRKVPDPLVAPSGSDA